MGLRRAAPACLRRLLLWDALQVLTLRLWRAVLRRWLGGVLRLSSLCRWNSVMEPSGAGSFLLCLLRAAGCSRVGGSTITGAEMG